MPNRTLVLDAGTCRNQLAVGINEALRAVNSKLQTALADAGVEVRDAIRYTMWADISNDEVWIRLTDDAEMPGLYLDLFGDDDLVLDALEIALKRSIKVLTCADLKRDARLAADQSGALVGIDGNRLSR